MQNFVKILDRNKRAQLRRQVRLKKDETNQLEWHLLQNTEHIYTELLERLDGVCPAHVSRQTSEARVDFLGPASPLYPVDFFARFYEMSRQELIIKVFAHQITDKGKARKIIRARYRIRLQIIRQSA